MTTAPRKEKGPQPAGQQAKGPRQTPCTDDRIENLAEGHAQVTRFADVTGVQATRMALDELLGDIVAGRPHSPSKEACPLFSAFTFGSKRTKKGSLRSTDNALQACAAVADYDAGKMSPEDARDRLAMYGVRAVIYTTGSHDPQAPRWRVIAPSSRPLDHAGYVRCVARLNGLFEGVFAKESFVVGQSYYYGHVEGREFVAYATQGGWVDQLEDLDAHAIYPREAQHAPSGANTVTDAEHRETIHTGADGVRRALMALAARFVGRGMSADDAIAALQDLMKSCEWREQDLARWQDRFDAIAARLVPSAVDKYSDRRAVTASHVPAMGDFVRTSKGLIPCTLTNVALALEKVLSTRGEVIYRSKFHNRLLIIVEGTVRDVDDDDVRAVWAQVQLIGDGLERVGKDLIHDAVAYVGRRFARDEVVDWLHGLRWDRVPRLDSLCEDAFGVERSAYHMAVFRNLLVACVARQYCPGTKFDHVVALISPQGKAKTTMLEVLFGTGLVASVPKDPTSRDSQLLTRGKLCVELDEMGAVRKAQVEELKSWITQTVDEYRDPYGRMVVRHPRRFVIVGTTNEREFLEDDENRRWWPVELTDSINLDYLRTNREQLFAEAIELYRTGHPFWEIPQDEAQAAQEQRRLLDPWQDAITQFIEAKGKEVPGGDDDDEGSTFMPWPQGFVSSYDLMSKWLDLRPAQQQGTHQTRRLAKAMRANGYKLVRSKGHWGGVRGYVPQDHEWFSGEQTWRCPDDPL